MYNFENQVIKGTTAPPFSLLEYLLCWKLTVVCLIIHTARGGAHRARN